MKKFSVICLLTFLLTGANVISKESENSENFETSLEVWSKLLNDVNKRLSKLENNFEVKEKQEDHNRTDIKDSIANLNARMDKIEEISSVLEIKNILKSFEGTLDVLNKRFSKIVKRLEDIEVKTAIIEKIYQVSQKPLETLMKVIDEEKAVITKMGKKLEEQEKMILAMDKSSKNQITSNETKAEIIKESNDRITEKESENIAGSTGKRVVFSEIEPNKTSKSDTEKPDTQNLTEIGKGIFTKNVELKPFGSSTKISGEVINKSNIDYSTANFKMHFYEKGGDLLKSHELSVLNFNIGSIKDFDELIPGIEPETIVRYDILFDDTELTTSTDKKNKKE
jgi:hypothetical protein